MVLERFTLVLSIAAVGKKTLQIAEGIFFFLVNQPVDPHP